MWKKPGFHLISAEPREPSLGQASTLHIALHGPNVLLRVQPSRSSCSSGPVREFRPIRVSWRVWATTGCKISCDQFSGFAEQEIFMPKVRKMVSSFHFWGHHVSDGFVLDVYITTSQVLAVSAVYERSNMLLPGSSTSIYSVSFKLISIFRGNAN